MKYDPEIHHRQSIRLQGYDYSANGAYFVTVCVMNKDCLFGEINEGEIAMNEAGRLVESWWRKLPDKFSSVEIDSFVIMPNHFHGIICIGEEAKCGGMNVVNPVGAAPCGRPVFECAEQERRAQKAGRPRGAAPTLGDVIMWFKTMTTNAYIRGVKQSNWPPLPRKLWQRNYYERIIRNERELHAARNYIRENPIKWQTDKENPNNSP